MIKNEEKDNSLASNSWHYSAGTILANSISSRTCDLSTLLTRSR